MTERLIDRLPEVAREIGGASHCLLCLDFDGTLAPIVTDPADARMPEETRTVLEALASRPGTTVAIVSGRGPEDLRTRVGLDVILAGNHGLDMLEKGIRWRHPEAARWEPVLHEMCCRLASGSRAIPGALVEDKGLTASVHYRKVASTDLPRLSEMVKTTVAPHEDHFFLREGKKVIEILPRVWWDKGSAVLRILERVREMESGEIAVCYIGDDLTDECAFRDLPAGITIRVGENCPTAARFRVSDPAEVYKFLTWLETNWLPAGRLALPADEPFQPQP